MPIDLSLDDLQAALPEEYLDHPFCPTCGRASVIRESPEWLLTKFNNLFGEILAVLIRARRERRVLSLTQLHREVEANRTFEQKRRYSAEDGQQSINTSITRHQQKLLSYGWAIVGRSATGTGVFLIPMDFADDGHDDVFDPD